MVVRRKAGEEKADLIFRALADRTQRWLANRHGRLQGKARAVQDPTIAQLVATSAAASSPAWDRLTEIARQRKAGG